MIIEIVYDDEREVITKINSLEIITEGNEETHFISFKDIEGGWTSVCFKEFRDCFLSYGDGDYKIVKGYKNETE